MPVPIRYVLPPALMVAPCACASVVCAAGGFGPCPSAVSVRSDCWLRVLLLRRFGLYLACGPKIVSGSGPRV